MTKIAVREELLVRIGAFIASELAPMRAQQAGLVEQIAKLRNDVMLLRSQIDELRGGKRLRVVANVPKVPHEND